MSDFEQSRRTVIDSRIRITRHGDLRLVFGGRRLPVEYKKNPVREVLDVSSFKGRMSLIEQSDHL